MIQAIAGVAPADVREVVIMTVWPSNASFGLGRFFGRWYAKKWGPYIFNLGNLVALLSVPFALVLYLLRIAPGIGTRYTLTNRRVVVQKGLRGVDDRWVDLGRFDRIEVQVLPGQEWYDAGDLVFYNEGTETFRLPGVSHPESFRQTCLKARQSHVGVQAAVRAALGR